MKRKLHHFRDLFKAEFSKENATIYNKTQMIFASPMAQTKERVSLGIPKNEDNKAPPKMAMVMEEYLMEYVETTVGRPLRWWDKIQAKPSMLADFAMQQPEPSFSW